MDILLYIISFVLIIGAKAYIDYIYGQIHLIKSKKGLTGYTVARTILDQKGLTDIEILEVDGILADHFNPIRKVVCLSSSVYHGDSIASVAIAAHECAHAYQHSEGYLFVKMKNFTIPIFNIASKLGFVVLLIGLIFSFDKLAFVGLILLFSTLLFHLVTLPVEFNASKRARGLLLSLSLIEPEEVSTVKKMLGAAAFTYVASLLVNLLQLIRFLHIFSDRND